MILIQEVHFKLSDGKVDLERCFLRTLVKTLKNLMQMAYVVSIVSPSICYALVSVGTHHFWIRINSSYN